VSLSDVNFIQMILRSGGSIPLSCLLDDADEFLENSWNPSTCYNKMNFLTMYYPIVRDNVNDGHLELKYMLQVAKMASLPRMVGSSLRELIPHLDQATGCGIMADMYNGVFELRNYETDPISRFDENTDVFGEGDYHQDGKQYRYLNPVINNKEDLAEYTGATWIFKLDDCPKGIRSC